MDVRAVLIVAPPTEDDATESIAGTRIATLDVLGRAVVLRIVDRLRRFGISNISVVSDVASAAVPMTRSLRKELPWTQSSNGGVWRAAEAAFSDHAQAGADLVLVLRVGAYTDLDFDDLVQFHLDQNSRVTWVAAPDGVPLDIAVVTSSRRNDAAFLFRHGLRKFRVSGTRYIFNGYANRLRDGADLRRLACDGLVFRAQIAPEGAELRPGVWVAPGARIQRGARVLAPAYIGPHVKVRAAAVITRGSVLEHHSVVDCGTVVEDSTVLPYTYIGAGLDVSHSVVGFRRLEHLRRGVETEIFDDRLIGAVSAHAPLRALGHAVSLATYLPVQILRGVFAKPHREAPTQLPEAVQAPSPAINPPAELQASEATEASQFPSNFVVARRYGNQ